MVSTLLPIFQSLLVFILGTAFGSFLSVMVNRAIKEETGIIFGNSQCPHCKHRLAAIDLIPLFSYLFLNGKCRYCGKKISIEYPLYELITGLVFLANFILINYHAGFDFYLISGHYLNLIFNFAYLSLLSIILLAISFADLKIKAIPNWFLLAWVFICLLGPFISMKLTSASVLYALLINLFFFGGQWLLSKGKWLGSGDIIFGIGMAFLLGLEKNLVALVFAYLIGSIIGLTLIGLKLMSKKDSVPFTPFLAIGTLLSLYFGNQIVIWYMTVSILPIP